MAKLTDIFRRLKIKRVVVFSLFMTVFSNPAFADPAVVNISVETKGRIVVMNARLLGGLTESITEAINGGIPVTFTYQVELVETRPFWPDKTVSINKVSNTVQYNSLKKLYRFSTNGRNIQRKTVTRDPNRYKELMSTLKEAPIASLKKLNPERTYYIKVKADVETDRLWFPFNYIFFFAPFNDVKTSWAKSSPLVWKTKIGRAIGSETKKAAIKRGEPSIIQNKDVIRTFN